MKKKDQETHVDKLWNTIKNNKLVALLIIFGAIIIAIGQFTGSLQTIRKFIGFSDEKKEIKRSADYEEMKTLFNKIHNDYKENFLYYLGYFENDGDPLVITRQLIDLNKLTANDRAKLVRMAKKQGNPEDNILYEQLMNYFGFSDTDYVHSEFDKENIFYQRWRKSIKDDIEWILAENWQEYFDPGASMPPMTEIEQRKKVAEMWDELKEPFDKEFDMEKLKKYLILQTIRSNLEKCQKLAVQIEKILDELKPNN